MSLKQFNKCATRPLYPGANHLITRILAEKPDLHRWGFVVPGSGNSAVIVMTENEVFKGPRNPERPEEILRECALLQTLADVDLGVRVPKVSTVACDGGFYGMERVAAVALTTQNLALLPEAEQHRVATAIGTFNARLAMQNGGSRVSANSITTESLRAVFENDDFWSESGWDPRLVNRLEDYLKRTPLPRPMLLHGDLHAQNVLYDPETAELSIIDIGGGDLITPHHTFGVMRAYFGNAFAGVAMESFAQQSGVQITHDDLDLYLYLQSLTEWSRGVSEIDIFGTVPQSKTLAETLDRLETKQPKASQTASSPLLAARR